MSRAHRKVAMVTGAGAGIGRACALRMAREGYAVVVMDAVAEGAETTRRRVEREGHKAVVHVGDVSDPATSESACRLATGEWGRIDVLVANAGVQAGGDLLAAEQRELDRVVDVNIKGVAHACRSVLPAMLEQGSGAIVITSSVNALLGVSGMTLYDASKAAVLGLMRSLAVQYGCRGVRVNAVCPGTTITDYHINRLASEGIDVDGIRAMTQGYGALGRAAEPEEIAAAIFFLASDDASFVTGHALVVDGGFSIGGR